jgi:hypothetical protein
MVAVAEVTVRQREELGARQLGGLVDRLVPPVTPQRTREVAVEVPVEIRTPAMEVRQELL